MTIVKEFTVRRYSTSSFDANTLLAFEPNGDKVWIKEKAYDATTLAPYYTTTSGTALTDKNLSNYHGLTQGMILTKYPFAMTGFQELDNQAANYNGYSVNLYEPSQSRFNLDKSTQGGNIFEFTSAQGVKHHLIWYQYPVAVPNVQGASYNAYINPYASSNKFVTRYTLIEGDDWTNPVASISGTLTGTTTGLGVAGQQVFQIIPVAVDPTNKFIYCRQVHAQNVTAAGYSSQNHESGYTRNLSMCKLPFTTRLDGTLAVSSASGSVIANGVTIYTTHSLDNNPVFYCGKNNDGTPMFMTQIENDTSITTAAGGNTSITTNTNYPAAKTLWTGVKTNSAPKIYFDKLAGGVQTNVASINTASNQFSSTGANKTMSSFAPSKFEASTASGETNIFYSYSLCFNSSSVPSIIYYRWDKATPTASANLCSIDWNGVTSTDKISFAFPTALAISSYLPQMATAHCFVTTLGSNRYLNVLHTYGNATNLLTKTSAGQILMTTFQIDTSTWQSLTYMGSISVSAYSYCSLDSDNTRIAVITAGAMNIYTCTAGVWNLTSSESGSINFVARDYNDRIWALDVGTSDYTTITATSSNYTTTWREHACKLHLHTSSLANLIRAEFVTRVQTYQGTNLSNNIRLNAYDTSSNRVATTVYLKLTGSAIFNENSSTTLSVTTSASGDTLVPITINGSGLVNISASFSV